MGKRLTTEEFIKKAREVHGDKYDYSQVEYVTNKTKVKIICPDHGVFLQRPSHHNRGKGCAECSGKKPYTNKTFIKKAREVHGDKYDYSQVEYTGSLAKVKIICPNHGVFLQIPSSHMLGYGCAECSGSKPYTTKTFIKKAREVHGDKYDYSQVQYVNSQTKVRIICPDHGVFLQIPSSHNRGIGCAGCHGNKLSTTEEFIKKAREVHGDKYDYSQVEYVTNKTKVRIICPDHGVFLQRPNAHNRGAGCAGCYGNKLSTTEEFIKKAREVHGDKYDYSQVQYVNSQTKVRIICPDHGVFLQLPRDHARGIGCCMCGTASRGWDLKSWITAGKNSRLFSGFKLYIILLSSETETFVKCGITCRSIKRRCSDIPYTHKRLHVEISDAETIWNIERKIHSHPNLKRYTPKIEFGGAGECFDASEADRIVAIVKGEARKNGRGKKRGRNRAASGQLSFAFH